MRTPQGGEPNPPQKVENKLLLKQWTRGRTYSCERHQNEDAPIQLTNFMELSPSSEAASCAVIQSESESHYN
jgi:hypothetical protein